MNESVIYDGASAQQRADKLRIQRTLAAEARGVEEGHTARWDAPRCRFLVTPEAGGNCPPYELTVAMVKLGERWLLTVSCTCPHGTKRRSGEPGVLGCKHRTRVARRLERLGFARLDPDARWVVTRRLADLAGAIEESEAA